MFGRLAAYLDSIRARDPAPHSRAEILLYPGVWALGLHRIAHRLYRRRLFFLARVVNHVARAWTAIDIHPGARIGRNFFIDHGFVVIGETAEIGDDVTIYQCVTLGGTSPDNGVAGKRHPTLADGVIIGSGAQVLGPILVGPRARVGANAVVTRDVPAGAVMVGIPARATMVEGGAAETPSRFVPYGTPCSEMFDPATQKMEIMRCEMESMRKRLDALLAEQGDRPQREAERDRA
ncbi:serine acetyltransferase [Sphingomonas sp. RP10(2022)]|uniref:Serine acetyltransferase n=1 Tax=Sphingomonas liriopis TaxID=2949094 RepID=A0A9X2HRY6_9SPHN|nr:serine O-acetyltransferase EpsC [Sphingomonas liriopis]MCP3734767.1 serine acetyltransferase [Sphingomonas liriopis]